MLNSECGRKGVPLNLNKEGTVHTNPDGSTVEVKKITAGDFFSKREKGLPSSGSSWLFPNHLEYNGWLQMNSLVTVELEELEDWV